MTNITVLDNAELKMTAEDVAMLQALYSRSGDSVTGHLEKVKNTGSGNFMKSYYVGYGHRSIGDCGTTTIFIEGVSSLAAKAIQDNKLYRGQETSSRYVSFENQPIFDPIKTEDSKQIIVQWMMLYKMYLPRVIEGLKAKHPLASYDTTETIWLNTISAKAFDICRGFLPVGMTTQLSWHTDLRQASDKCFKLLNHPLKEIRDLAFEILTQLTIKYPSSFDEKRINNHIDHYSIKGRYAFEIAAKENYLDLNLRDFGQQIVTEEAPILKWTDNIDVEELNLNEINILRSRPKGMELPKYLEKYGTVNIKYSLDWGSFRDIQRHRDCTNQIPLVKSVNPNFLQMNNWYIAGVEDALGNTFDEIEVERFQGQLERAQLNTMSFINDVNIYDAQYFYPFGTQVLCELNLSIPELVYIYELRSSQMVHPTLRNVVKHFKDILRNLIPTIALYGDSRDDEFSVKRGTQTIKEK